MTVVAYAPKPGYEDPDCLGAIFVHDALDVNVRELYLGGNDGVFLVDDPAVQEALDRYEPLKRVPLPKAAPKSPPSSKPTAGGDK